MTVTFRHEHVFAASAAKLIALMQDPAASRERSYRLGAAYASCEWRAVERVEELREARDTRFNTDPFETLRTTRWSEDGASAEWTLVQTGGPGEMQSEGRLEVEAISERRSRLTVEGALTIEAGPVTTLVERLVRMRIRRAREQDFSVVERQLREGRC